MNLIKLNPFLRYASMHTRLKPSTKFSVCYDCRLFYFAQGKGDMVINGKTYLIGSNDAVFLPPKTKYRFNFNTSKDLSVYVLNFDLIDEFCKYKKSLSTPTEETFDELLVLSYELPEKFQNPIVVKNAFSVRKHVEKCVDLFLQKTTYYQEESSARAKQALLELLRESEIGEYPLVQNVIDYIRENYHLPELSNDMIAENFNYHPYHLNRIVKAYTQKTLHGYLLDYRIQMAKNLLITTKLSITQIADKTGFTSYTYFIKLFREKTGQSPLKYRNNHELIRL
ncbi:MAG: helix-turn-helix domain-containing protein [Clostridia bacterium]|nr:helix-turn-helix domain-containing protein [Clostridia bacterium]